MVSEYIAIALLARSCGVSRFDKLQNYEIPTNIKQTIVEDVESKQFIWYSHMKSGIRAMRKIYLRKEEYYSKYI